MTWELMKQEEERKSTVMEIKILYEDHDTLVICKPSGTLSEDSERDASVVRALASYGTDGFLPAPITRLDREVSGAMLLAKSKESAAYYTALMSDREAFQKEYLAVVSGVMQEPIGKMQDLLFKDSSKNKSYVVKRMRRGVKKASLSYEVLDTQTEAGSSVSLLKIRLHTGRTHQIRVQCASRGHSLLGDRRYGGAPTYPIGLFAYKLTFRTREGKCVAVCARPPEEAPFSIFAQTLGKIPQK